MRRARPAWTPSSAPAAGVDNPTLMRMLRESAGGIDVDLDQPSSGRRPTPRRRSASRSSAGTPRTGCRAPCPAAPGPASRASWARITPGAGTAATARAAGRARPRRCAWSRAPVGDGPSGASPARGRGTSRSWRDAAEWRPGDRPGHRPARGARRGGRGGGRERLGQVAHDAGHDAAAGAAPGHRRGAASASRARELDDAARGGDAPAARRPSRDGLPGPDDLAQPADAHRRPGDGGDDRARRARTATPRTERWSCWRASSCPIPAVPRAPIPTSSRVACASARSSRWRSPCARGCSSRTSRRPRST